MPLPLATGSDTPRAAAPGCGAHPLADWQRLGLEASLAEVLPELIQLRRHIHRHPELSGHEQQTAALVAGELRRWGWRVREGVGRTGVLAELGPEGPDVPLVALRVDMDALPVEERTGLDYASTRQGLMHACGHDLHTAVGLGVAHVLAPLAGLLTARVRLLFQPAEETAQGAAWMRADGAMEGVQALFGVHVFPSLAVGSIGVRCGSLTAAAGELEVEVLGEGGHGARPHQSTDAIWIAARVVSGLQEAISRRLDALHPVVVSFGRIEGGKAFNVIADHVRLLGTVRCLDLELHSQLPGWIEDTVQALCRGHGGEARVRYRCISPPVHNDPELTELVAEAATELLGRDQVRWLEQPSLGAEDFAELQQGTRGTMFRLGVAGATGCTPLHSNTFAPDEAALAVGVKVLTLSLLRWMERQASAGPLA
ncbi:MULTISPECIES: amidohydrolase [unclassified Synechococcus]|jgi:amidohydrolase|uniref:amidohydrolase n=1 Tax=unclassified Synechococcus TaxID=2626047 RepID=UPI0018CD6AFC|nr:MULTISPECIES: amidohydrolase [unclassified Synechococcus]MEA5421806.1 amidohydrolase [Synechococcus sp. CCY9202]QPN60925.1 amidohydrolase [Synechococcus sp. CBW1002]CAK6702061.1 N-acetylcysteine deacetylase [Synechococcus sp. CBW1107]